MEEEFKLKNYHEMKADELLDYHGYFLHEEGRKLLEKRIRNSSDVVRSKIDEYFLKVLGKKPDKELSSDVKLVPEDYIINPKEIFKKGRELVDHIVLDHIKRNIGENAAKDYAENPDQLRSYAESQLGVNYGKLMYELQKYHGNVSKLLNEQDSHLNKIIQSIASNDKVLVHNEGIKRELMIRSQNEEDNKIAHKYLMDRGVDRKLASKTTIGDIASSTIMGRLANNQKVAAGDYLKDAVLFEEPYDAMDVANEAYKENLDVKKRIKLISEAAQKLPKYGDKEYKKAT